MDIFQHHIIALHCIALSAIKAYKGYQPRTALLCTALHCTTRTAVHCTACGHLICVVYLVRKAAAQPARMPMAAPPRGAVRKEATTNRREDLHIYGNKRALLRLRPIEMTPREDQF
jgi:hypothetical protein